MYTICRNRYDFSLDFDFSKNLGLFLDECQMTVMGRIILRFFYKVWFFGAIYFCLSWLYLLVNIDRDLFVDDNL
jgi:hypothetical protein